MKPYRLSVLLSLALVTGARLAATTIDIGATDDRTAGVSAGVANSLQSDNDVFLRTFGVSSVWRSALEFSLTSLTGPITINSATLRLVDAGTEVAGTIQVHGYTGDGVVTLGDFGYSNLLTSYNTTDTSSVIRVHLLDVTSFIQDQIDANSSFSGFMLRSSNEGLFQGADIASSEWSDPNYRPLLTIDYSAAATPDGGTSAVMIGASLVVLATVRRRLVRS